MWSSKAKRMSARKPIRYSASRAVFQAWPDVPIRVFAGRDDRQFPIEFQRRVAKERLGVAVDELSGGHLIALSNPRGLVDELLTYL